MFMTNLTNYTIYEELKYKRKDPNGSLIVFEM